MPCILWQGKKVSKKPWKYLSSFAKMLWVFKNAFKKSIGMSCGTWTDRHYLCCLVFSLNSALLDELAHLEEKLVQAKEERRYGHWPWKNSRQTDRQTNKTRPTK